jgi:hypothetical protein
MFSERWRFSLLLMARRVALAANQQRIRFAPGIAPEKISVRMLTKGLVSDNEINQNRKSV